MENFSNSKLIEEALQREILKSEDTRAKLLGIAALIFAFALSTITVFYYRDFIKVFNQKPIGIYIVVFLFLLLAFREYNISKFLKKMLKKGKVIKPVYRYVNLFLETSLPTVMMLIVALVQESNLIILTPAPYVYFVFIILSVLSLDYKLTIFTGLTAAVEYFILVLYLLNKYDNPEMSLLLKAEYFYMGKSIILLISGGLAGYAAEQLKKKIFNSFEIISERNKIVNMFGQQVSKEIVDELLSQKEITESKRKFVCIMFLDIRGFTPFSEKREPEEIIKYQNDVFGFMIEIITKNYGIINQFLGDGYMATFGAPVSRGNDCLNAIKAAQEIIKTVNEKNKSGEITETHIGIGLHAGYVVAGNVGTSIRKQYSITGNTVIMASRVEQLNKIYNSQLLISEEVLNEIDKSAIEYEFIGPVQVKGRENPINIYKLA